MKRYFYIIIQYFQQHIFEITCAVLFSLLLMGCTTIKEVPINNVEKVIYKDSLIYIKDSIYIHLPVEEKTNSTQDSSHLETSVAISDAWVDNDGNLNHTIKNKNKTIKTPIDTILVTQTKEVLKEKEKPIYYEKTIPLRDSYFWFYWFYFYGSLFIIIYKIIKKYSILK